MNFFFFACVYICVRVYTEVYRYASLYLYIGIYGEAVPFPNHCVACSDPPPCPQCLLLQVRLFLSSSDLNKVRSFYGILSILWRRDFSYNCKIF